MGSRPEVDEGDFELIVGDAAASMRRLPPDSVQCVVTSPPYYLIRNYHVDGQIGLEASPDEHIAALVAVFEEVRRILRPDGTCWINYADIYASSGLRRQGNW